MERRVVAAALIPPTEIQSEEDEMIYPDDDMMSFKHNHDEIPDSPMIADTMKSFAEKGFMKTIGDRDKFKPRYPPGFKHSEERDKPSGGSGGKSE